MLFGWMKSVIFYLLLAGLALHMAPTNEYRRYIRYFIGLVVLVLLASPISYMFHLGSGDLQDLLMKMEDVDVSLNGEHGPGGDLYDYYDLGLRESIRQALNGYGVKDVSLVTDSNGEILSCTVIISGTTQENDSLMHDSLNDDNISAEEQIKKYISDVYNVAYARIYVVRR